MGLLAKEILWRNGGGWGLCTPLPPLEGRKKTFNT